MTGTSEYKDMPVSSVFEKLNCTAEGLSEKDVEERVKQYGYNEIVAKKPNPLLEFLSRFWGPIPWLLEIAAILSAVVGEVGDAFLIFFLLLMNTIIGFIEESNSQKALDLLKKKMTVKARLLRDGKWDSRESRELVPGDIIVVGLGDVVPADAKIISGELSVDQSALSGESLPVNVKDEALIYTGSTVKRGEAKCVVVGTGKNTFFGKTVELVNIAKPKSKQEEVMLQISKYMIYLGAIIFVFVLIYGLSIKATALTLLTFAVLFIGGGVPAALPVMFTVSQATGAGELAKKGILITKLDSIENAASVEVLCLDKTGTITKNQLEVSEIVPFAKATAEEVLLTASMASSQESKDAIDQTILKKAEGDGIDLKAYTQTSFKPFEPATKRAEATIKFKNKTLTAIKGAPQIVLGLCKKTSAKDATAINERIAALSTKGCRALGVAKAEGSGELTFVGLVALSDPIRPDTKDMIAEMRNAGIMPQMLTGDNIAVATEIAKQAGIGDKIVRIAELKKLGDAKMAEAIKNYNGLAEIYPEDKFSVVKLWQSMGKMVGMTGDGVNDAPALKQAEMGVAVADSTDVAKAAASMVLTEPGTHLIIEAVKTSRQIYQRMLTWALNKIMKSIQFLGIVTIGFFWFQDIIISISGLMLIVFVNDFLTLSLAKDNARPTANPNNWNVVNLSLASLFMGVFFIIQGLTLLWIGLNYFQMPFNEIQSLMILLFAYTSMFRILMVRERGHFWDSMPDKGVLATVLFTVVVFTLLAIFGVVIDKIAVPVVLFALGFTLASMVVLDFPKYYVFKKLHIA